MLTNFRLESVKNRKKKTAEPRHVSRQEAQILLLDLRTFEIGAVRYVRYTKKSAVVNPSPYRPFDLNNEDSCHHILLLYFPWGSRGEDGILGDHTCAVDRVAYLMSEKLFPAYTDAAFAAIKHQETMLDSSNTGRPHSDGCQFDGAKEGGDNDSDDEDGDGRDDHRFLVMADDIEDDSDCRR